MIETNIKFEHIDDIPVTALVNKLGPEYAKTFDDKPSFFIKTRHTYKQVKYNDGNFVFNETTEYKTFFLTIHQISNGWIGTFNGHFVNDYKDHIVTDICKVNFE